MYICSVYKEFPWYNLSIEIKGHKFCRFQTLLYHHSSKPGHIPDLRLISRVYELAKQPTVARGQKTNECATFPQWKQPGCLCPSPPKTQYTNE